MIKFSIFLILLALGILGFTLSPMFSPNDSSLLDLMEPLLCNSGDNILQEATSNATRVNNTSNTFAINMSLICKRADGTTYNVTDKLLGMGMTGFVVLLGFGVLFLIVGIIRALSGGGSSGRPQPAGAGWTPPYYTPSPTPMQSPSGGGYPQVTVTSQPGYSNSYPTTVGYSAPPAPAPSDKFNFDSAATMQNIPKPSSVAASSSQGGGELTTRLKQLREAYDAGLITSEEYERTKSDLLRDFSDDN